MKLKLPIYCKDVNKKILECIPEMIKLLNDPTLAPYVILTEGSRYSGKSQGWGRITAGLINKGALMSVLLGAPTESGMMSGFAGLIKDLTNGDYKIWVKVSYYEGGSQVSRTEHINVVNVIYPNSYSFTSNARKFDCD